MLRSLLLELNGCTARFLLLRFKDEGHGARPQSLRVRDDRDGTVVAEDGVADFQHFDLNPIESTVHHLVVSVPAGRKRRHHIDARILLAEVALLDEVQHPLPDGPFVTVLLGNYLADYVHCFPNFCIRCHCLSPYQNFLTL